MVCDQRRDGGDIQHTEGDSSRAAGGGGGGGGNPDLPVRRSQRKLGPFTVMILKKSISFQSYIFTAYQVKDGKELARSLLVFSLLKIIHPFQNKNYLRT